MESIFELYSIVSGTSSRLHRALISEAALIRAVVRAMAFAAGVVGVLLLHGYHPYADDAAIYVAGVKHLLHPEFYNRLDSPFLEAQGRLSIFERLIALVVRITGAQLEWVLLLVQTGSILAMLAGAWRLARSVFASESAAWWAFALAAASFTLPIAGTSIAVMDPYLTARAITTPLALLSICALVDEAWNSAALLTLAALAIHPLMGACLLLFEAVFLCYTRPSRWRLLTLLAALLIACFALAAVFSSLLPFDEPYRRIVWGRPYLFLSRWAWYEYAGIAAPLVLSAFAWRWTGRGTGRRAWARHSGADRIRDLNASIVISGTLVTLCCAAFVHPSGSMLLARLQPLRIFQVIYLVGIVLLGGWASGVYRRHTKAILIFPVMLALGTSLAQRAMYAGRLNVELPTRSDPNSWHQGFVWIQRHTAPDALFGADPDLMELPREGHEGFRAAAERGILGTNKDGGVVVISPALAGRWTSQHEAQANLATESDAERVEHLAPFRVGWILLPASAGTSFACPFQNDAMKVCRMPGQAAADVSRLEPNRNQDHEDHPSIR